MLAKGNTLPLDEQYVEKLYWGNKSLRTSILQFYKFLDTVTEASRFWPFGWLAKKSDDRGPPPNGNPVGTKNSWLFQSANREIHVTTI